jgi:glycine/D-amino acid oxidase-like deaminating enzyme
VITLRQKFAGIGDNARRQERSMPSEETPWGATWYAATMVDAPRRAALAGDVDVDVCVIGAGLAGLTAARELARRGWSVAVLEARRVAWNASGRNAGLVAPGFAERLEAIVERVGLRRAKELWALSTAGVDYVHTTIRETEMPGVEPVHGWLAVRRTDDEEAVLRLVAMLRVDFGVNAEACPTEEVREVLRTPAYYQAVHMPEAFHVHALNYALGLASAAERAGARIYEDSPAVALDVLGVRKRIETLHGRVRANHIVLAGGPHLADVFPPIAGTVVPVASYIATTAPLGERLAEAITYPGVIADTRRAGDYYRVIGGDRLMWGGRITSRLSAPRRLPKLLRGDIVRVYPQLADVEIEYAWSGTMSYAVHKMPQIGELTPGVWLAGAFGGHGLNTTAMAGDLIARAIIERDDRWRLFSAYELVWAGGKVGPAASQILYWSMQLRDAIEERLSHRRESARRRADTVTPAAVVAVGRTTAEFPLPAAAAAARTTAEVPLPVFAEPEFVHTRGPVPVSAAVEDAHGDNAQRAFEAAAEAARSIAEEFAHARARAEREWSRAPEPEPLLAGSPEEARPDDAAPVKIGAFSPQFMTSSEPMPIAESPHAREMAVAPQSRWPRRGSSED